MNKQNLRLLATALRSGEYNQVDGHLKDGQNYCVWGVACEVFRQATGQGEWIPYSGSVGGVQEAFRIDASDPYGDAFSPPDEVTAWYGLDTYNNEKDDEFVEELMSSNDTGEDFTALAGLLEGLIESPSDNPLSSLNVSTWPPREWKLS